MERNWITRGGRARRDALLLMAALPLLGVTACASSDEETGGGQPESLKVLVPIQGDVLDPTRVTVSGLGPVLIALEPLMRFQSDGTFEPALATEMETPTPTTYVYTIRPDVTFWDDTPLTAEDVVFSLNLHAAPESESLNHPFWLGVTSIEATADDQVTITLAEPDAQFVYAIATAPIVSKAFYDANAKTVGTPETLNMGTGPYEFSSFRPSSQTTYTANPSYWGPEPAYETLQVDTVSDDATRLAAIQSGEFDAIYDIPLSQLSSYTGIDGFDIAEPAKDASIYKFNFDMTKPPFNDIHLRRAFIMAIDRETIVEGTLGGHATLAPTLVPPDMMKTVADLDEVDSVYAELEEGLAYDPAGAEAEIAQSATPDGLEVTLLVTGSNPNLSLIAQTAAQDLEKIGITLDIKEVDDNTFYNAVYFEHTTDGVSLEVFSGTNPDPANIPNYALASQFGLPKGGQGSNLSDFDDPEVDRLLAESQSLATDDPQRGSLVLQALQAAQADPPFMPLAFPELYAGAGGGLEIAEFTSFWWMTSWPDAIAAP